MSLWKIMRAASPAFGIALRSAKEMSMIRRFLFTLLVLAALALLIFVVVGGRVDLNFRAPSADVKVDGPDVDVDKGQLPKVNVDPGRAPKVDVDPADKPK
jgi:hypothetical protein